MKPDVRIRDIAAVCGGRAQGFVSYGETAAGPMQFPVVIVNGAHDGPTLCLTAGVHATEYAPIDAVMRVIRALDPLELRGAVIAVPVANMPMFAGRNGFVSPVDGLNLNKVGMGRSDGTASELLAHTLLDEVIGRAQYHIDLHAGDLGEMLLPFVGYALTGVHDLDAMGETLARLYSPRLVSISTGEAIPPFADGIVFAASRRGVVSLFAESGGNGTLEESDVSVHLDGVRAVMQHLGMIHGAPVSTPGQRIAARDRTVIRATRAGLLRLKVAIGDEISPGQEVAEICNVFGETVECVRAQGRGIAGLVWAHKVVNTGDPIVRYWITQPAP
jgi:predicted deacylase